MTFTSRLCRCVLVGCLVAFAIANFFASSIERASASGAPACCRLDIGATTHGSFVASNPGRSHYVVIWSAASQGRAQLFSLEAHTDEVGRWPPRGTR